MTIDKRRKAIWKLQSEIKGDPRAWKERTLATFLRQLGIKRLSAKSISDIDHLLSINSLHVADDGTERAWHKRSRSEKLRFIFAPQPELEPTLDFVGDVSNAKAFLTEDVVSPARLLRSRAETPAIESHTRKDQSLSWISPAKGDNPLPLFLHQRQAVHKLDDKLSSGRKTKRFAGLLVIPTGGGKTRTAVHWVLRNVVNHGGKVLWIAHRHELLEQARSAFERNAFQDVLPDRDRISCRVISGVHGQPTKITSDDDVVVASVHSVRPGTTGARHLVNKWLRDNKDVFLVIDEAHHAPARTYRQLIDVVENNCSCLRMIGLTATPFRTAKREQGHLKAIFPDDIVFRVGLNQLISRGILSEPLFRTPETRVNLQDELDLTDNDMRRLRKSNFNLDMLGETAQRKLAENRRRNRFIVNHFLSNRSEYGQTLVFAVNVLNAIALNHLFVQDGVKSEVVIGNLQDMKRARNVSPKENKEAIQRFRAGETNVLINVNILTEGTDLPNVKTVFLTRPTTSKTLMMQMIGRGLRGPQVKDEASKTSGTKETYIVSFIDEWAEKIDWVSPEHLFIEENVDFDDHRPETKERLIRLISIDKIEEFARILDESVNTRGLETLPFLQRVPIGVYAFSILPEGEKGDEQSYDVLVYDSTQESFADFVGDLPRFLEIHGYGQKASGDRLDEATLDELANSAESTYFQGVDPVPGYQVGDLRQMSQYCYMYGFRPEFIPFEQREQFNVDEVARQIFEEGLGGKRKVEFVEAMWEDTSNAWQAFFGYNKRYFVREVGLALERLEFPTPAAVESEPAVEYPDRPLEEFSLAELWETHPQFARQIRNEVFQKAKTRSGEYKCAISKETSPFQVDFEIDHIIPRSEGGLTTMDNLQLVLRKENRRKGASRNE